MNVRTTIHAAIVCFVQMMKGMDGDDGSICLIGQNVVSQFYCSCSNEPNKFRMVDRSLETLVTHSPSLTS